MTSQDRAVEFRRTAGAFATGVGIVSSVYDDIPLAMTVNSFTTVSLNPTLVLTCLKHRSRLLGQIRDSGIFAVTVLAADQRDVARWFADARRPSGAAAFAGVRVHRAPATGCLVFTEGLAYFDCRVRDLSDQGDHSVVIGEAVSYGALNPAKAPLLYLNGSYRSIAVAPSAVSAA
ncbi:flavin reductase family protein [Micromonospora peucetia]|uniref:Flavin reductase family protein n=1 Tax=Micromonospora peucetia TaxID=47871 RepID=A0A1C6UKV9_9ACTN|nr:flavin reductase family protein [Micromonospora peucetia]MCX4386932.1 flavin reductase family protein [Micromonospora peucetia]WSA34246.1 flavin reductase family protein [Micromonospora peucetia]SCL54601.1 NADH-FMN oxidoreductase RutF, flavin reductase (DIM6/NTAB) family [Micromonospora peucetia]